MKKAIIPLALVIIAAFGIFIYINRFTVYYVSDVDGYAFNSDTILNNLTLGLNKNSEEVGLEKIKMYENVYQSGNKYYVGEESKNTINLNFPIVSSDSSSLYIISELGHYIDNDFYKKEAYNNTVLSDGYLYNGINYTRVDDYNYIFLALKNGLYINLQPMFVYKEKEPILIPANSFIFFGEDYLRYYKYSGKEYKYDTIGTIKKDTTVRIDDIETNYDLLLKKLGASNEDDEIILETIDAIEENPEKEQLDEIGLDTGNGKGQANIVQPKPVKKKLVVKERVTTNEEQTGGETDVIPWIDENVRIYDMKANVYSFSYRITIRDEQQHITKAPILEIINADTGATYATQSSTATGEYEITGLMPDTHYYYKFSYQYNSEYGGKATKKVLNLQYGDSGETQAHLTIDDNMMEFYTKPISELERIELSIGNISTLTNKATFENIQLGNDAKDEVLKGIKYVNIKFKTGQLLQLSTGNIRALTTLSPVTLTTAEVFDSNRVYEGVIEFVDIANNTTEKVGELKITNDKNFSFKTKRAAPTANVDVVPGSQFTKATAEIEIINKDKVQISTKPDAIYYDLYYYDYETNRYEIYPVLDEEGNPMERNLKVGDNSNIKLNGLLAETKYILYTYCSYKDDFGDHNNTEIGRYQFSTKPATSLGNINANVVLTELTSDGVDFNIVLDDKKINNEETSESKSFELLYEMLDPKVYIVVKESGSSETLYNVETTKEELKNGYTLKLHPDTNPDLDRPLKSNTSYEVVVTPTITVKTSKSYKTYDMKCILSNNRINTLKKPAKFEHKNEFKADGYLAMDVCVEDIDGSVIDKYVTYKVLTAAGGSVLQKQIKTQTECTSDEHFERLIVSNQKPGNYKVSLTASQYSELKAAQSGTPKSLFDREIALEGTSGIMTLNGLIDSKSYEVSVSTQPNGVNLFDINNISRWKKTIETAATTIGSRTVNINNNTVSFTTKNGYTMYSYYLPELAGKDVTVSFESSVVAPVNESTFCLINGGTSTCTSALNITSTLKTSANQNFSKRLQFNIGKLDKSGYITFYLTDGKKISETKWTIKNIKIEYGTSSNGYSSFGLSEGTGAPPIQYVGDFNAKIEKKVTKSTAEEIEKEGIEFNTAENYDYFIQFYLNGDRFDSQRVESKNGVVAGQYYIDQDLIVERLQKDSEYEARLVISPGSEIFYEVSKTTFTSENETRSVTEVDDMSKIHTYGYYLVTQDLHLETAQNTSKFTGSFMGTVDFQGHTVYLSTKEGAKTLFESIGGSGVVQNLNIVVDMNNTTAMTGYTALTSSNYGTIKNVKITVKSSLIEKNDKLEVVRDDYTTNPLKNRRIGLLGTENYGLVDNVIFNLEVPIYALDESTLGFWCRNYGTMRNLYAVGKPIISNYHNEQSRYIGVFGTTISNSAILEDFYSTVNVVVGNDFTDDMYSCASGYTYPGEPNAMMECYVEKEEAQKTYKETEYETDRETGELKPVERTKYYACDPYSADGKGIYVSTNTSTHKCKFKFYYSMRNASAYNESLLNKGDGRAQLGSNNYNVGLIAASASNSLISNFFFVDSNVIYEVKTEPKEVENIFKSETEGIPKGTYSSTTGRPVTQDALINSRTNINSHSLYYISNDEYTDVVGEKIGLTYFADENFIKETINYYNAFKVHEGYVKNILPHLDISEDIIKQEEIELPKFEGEGLLEILSVDSVEQDYHKFVPQNSKKYNENTFAEIKFSFYNPSKYNILSIKFENLPNIESASIVASTPNSENIQIVTAYLEIPAQNLDNYAYKDEYIIEDIEFSNKGSDAVKGTMCSKSNKCDLYDKSDTTNNTHRKYKMSLYKNVYSLKELADDYNGGLGKNSNYRIAQDISCTGSNCKNGTSNIFIENFTGNIDGGGFIIEDLQLTNCLIGNLNGTIKNMRIDGLKIGTNAPGGSAYANMSGLICKLKPKSVVSNVAIKNEEATAAANMTKAYVSGLVAYSESGTIQSSSVNGFEIKDFSSLAKAEVVVGSLLGYGETTILKQSFARNVVINVNSFVGKVDNNGIATEVDTAGVDSAVAVGGLVGQLKSGSVESVYVTGGVSSAFSNVGGIVGYSEGNIREAISKVSVIGGSGNVGNIVGYAAGEALTNIAKTIALGDILTKAENVSSIDRTSGIAITYNNNFAWEKQAINSKIISTTNGETLLNEEDLANPIIFANKVGLSSMAFDFDNFRTSEQKMSDGTMGNSGYIPMIKDSDTGVIIPNQGYDIYDPFEDEEIDDLLLHYIEMFTVEDLKKEYHEDGHDDVELIKSEEYKANYAKIILSLNNKNNFQITNVSFEGGIDTIEARDLTIGLNADTGLYDVVFKAYPKKFQDSYIIDRIDYIDPITGQELPYYTTLKVSASFYGKIVDTESWMNIKKGTYLNYLVQADVDLSQPNSKGVYCNADNCLGKTFANLRGYTGKGIIDSGENGNTYPTIHNLELSGLPSNIGLVDNVLTEVRDVNFANISLSSSAASGNYFGIFRYVSGKLYGQYNETTTKQANNSSIHFKNITISAPNVSRTGIIAYYKGSDLKYIYSNMIYVGGSSYVGGLIGEAISSQKNEIRMDNVYVNASGDYIGGYLGYEPEVNRSRYNFNITGNNLYVKGRLYVGGLLGRASGQFIYVTGSDNNYTFENAINDNEFNGMKLRLNNVPADKKDTTAKMKNVIGTGTGDAYIGGAMGRPSAWDNDMFQVKGMNIKSSGNSVGGVVGCAINLTISYAQDCTIEGVNHVGGVTGRSGDVSITNVSSVGNTIKATANYAGGIVGYLSDTTLRNAVVTKNVKVQANNYAGGIVGGTEGYGSDIQIVETNAQVYAENEGAGGFVGYLNNSSQTSTNRYDLILKNGFVANTQVYAKNYSGGLIGRINKTAVAGRIENIAISATVECDAGQTLCGYVIGGAASVNSINSGDFTLYTEGVLKIVDDEMTDEEKEAISKNPWVTPPKQNISGLRINSNTLLNRVKLADATDSKVKKCSTGELNQLTYKCNISLYNGFKGSANVAYRSNLTGNMNSGDDDKYYPYYSSTPLSATNRLSFDYNDPATYELTKSLKTDNLLKDTNFYQFPSVKVYTSGVDKVNIEFGEINPQATFTVNNVSRRIEEKTYTFYYDYQEDFEIELNYFMRSKKIKISKDDVVNTITVIGEYYYYLDNDGNIITNAVEVIPEKIIPQQEEKEENVEKVYGTTQPENVEEEALNIEEITEEVAIEEENQLEPMSTKKHSNITYKLDGEEIATVINDAVNVYKNEVLLENKDIYNIKTGETKENDFENLTLVKTNPLYEFEYAGQKIETYYSYSVINGKEVDKQIYVKDNTLEIVESTLDNVKDQIIIDRYNDKEFLVYLGYDGKLHSLKDEIVYPTNFKNINIESISSNVNNNSTVMFVKYQDGSYMAFNYLTGEVIDSETNKEVSLIDYVKSYIAETREDIAITTSPSKENKEYKEAKELVQKLKANPIKAVVNSDYGQVNSAVVNTSAYSVTYDPITDDYYVYELPQYNNKESEPIAEKLNTTVDSIIESDRKLMEFYNKEKESTKVSIISSIKIIAAILAIIGLLILILGKFVKKQNDTE